MLAEKDDGFLQKLPGAIWAPFNNAGGPFLGGLWGVPLRGLLGALWGSLRRFWWHVCVPGKSRLWSCGKRPQQLGPIYELMHLKIPLVLLGV